MRSRLCTYYLIAYINIINCIIHHQQISLRRACAVAIQLLELSSVVPLSSAATLREETQSTFSIPCNNYFSTTDSLISLQNIVLIGSGGGGTVFSAKFNNRDEYNVLKVSNLMSIKSVDNECAVLRFLDRKMKSSNYYTNFPLKVEKCLASCSPSAIVSSSTSSTSSLPLPPRPSSSSMQTTSHGHPATTIFIPDSEMEFSTGNNNNAIKSIFQSEPTNMRQHWKILVPPTPTKKGTF